MTLKQGKNSGAQELTSAVCNSSAVWLANRPPAPHLTRYRGGRITGGTAVDQHDRTTSLCGEDWSAPFQNLRQSRRRPSGASCGDLSGTLRAFAVRRESRRAASLWQNRRRPLPSCGLSGTSRSTPFQNLRRDLQRLLLPCSGRRGVLQPAPPALSGGGRTSGGQRLQSRRPAAVRGDLLATCRAFAVRREDLRRVASLWQNLRRPLASCGVFVGTFGDLAFQRGLRRVANPWRDQRRPEPLGARTGRRNCGGEPPRRRTCVSARSCGGQARNLQHCVEGLPQRQQVVG